MVMTLRVGDKIGQRDVIAQLIRMQYKRNETDFSRGTFRVRGDTIDVFPAEHSELAIRIELFDDEVESLQLLDPLTGPHAAEDPALHRLPEQPLRDAARARAGAIETIKEELRERLRALRGPGQAGGGAAPGAAHPLRPGDAAGGGPLQGHRELHRHLSGAAPGEPPPTLVDYLPDDALMFLDESHVLIGQLGGMYNGDRARKTTLVEYGFRLPSALDNRPLKFEEFEPRCARRCSSRPRRPTTRSPRRPGGRAGGAAHRPGRPRGRGAPGRHQVDDVLQEIRCAWKSASGCWSPR
jgi:excinuclease ABC subunit B